MALSDLGVIQPGMTPSGMTLKVVRQQFGDMIRSWSSNRLRLFFVPEVQYAITANLGVFQIGPGAAQFDTSGGLYTRPVFVQSAQTIIGTGRRYPLNILTRPEWDALTSRGNTDPDGPTEFFYDFNHPIATFNFAPILPLGSPNQTVFISQWNPLRIFADGEEALNVEDYYPDEYIVAMRRGLVIQLASGYRMQITQDMLGVFQAAISVVESKNLEKLTGSFGPSRTLQTPTKGDQSVLSAVQQQQQTQQGQ